MLTITTFLVTIKVPASTHHICRAGRGVSDKSGVRYQDGGNPITLQCSAQFHATYNSQSHLLSELGRLKARERSDTVGRGMTASFWTYFRS